MAPPTPMSILNSTKSSTPIAAPQVISAMAEQLLSLSAKIGRSSAGPKASPRLTPAQVGIMLARCTRPSGATGPENERPTPMTDGQAIPASRQDSRRTCRAASTASAGA